MEKRMLGKSMEYLFGMIRIDFMHSNLHDGWMVNLLLLKLVGFGIMHSSGQIGVHIQVWQVFLGANIAWPS